jgi:hypothetical protein
MSSSSFNQNGGENNNLTSDTSKQHSSIVNQNKQQENKTLASVEKIQNQGSSTITDEISVHERLNINEKHDEPEKNMIIKIIKIQVN